MVNDTTALGYILMLGKDTTLDDLKGLDEVVFYFLYQNKVWGDLNGLTLHKVYLVVKQNMYQQVKQESVGTVTNQSVLYSGSGVTSTQEPEGIRVTLQHNMVDEGSSRFVELVLQVVKKCLEESYELFSKGRLLYSEYGQGNGLVQGLATDINEILKDVDEIERLGVLTEDDVRYINYEIKEFLEYLEQANKWWVSTFAHLVKNELIGKEYG